MRFLLDRFAGAPDRVAFVDDGRAVTYGEVVARVADYSDLLERQGVARGDVVVAVADYSPEMFCFILALALNGNVLAPLTHESVVERDSVMEIAEAQWFVEFQPRIEDITFEA